MKTRDLVFMAFYAALFLLFEWVTGNYFKFLSMPQGGSLELSVLPLILASYHLGFRKGLLTALVAVAVRMVFLPVEMIAGANVFVVAVQLFFDYILAYGIYGLVQLLKNQYLKRKESLIAMAILAIAGIIFTLLKVDINEQAHLYWTMMSLWVFSLVTASFYIVTKKSQPIPIYWGVIVATFIRFMSHNIAGWVFYSSYYEGNVLWGVVGYNATYMLPNLILLLLVCGVIIPRLSHFLKINQ